MNRAVPAVVALLLLAGCSTGAVTPTAMPVPSASATPSATASATPTPDPEQQGPVQPVGTAVSLASGLRVPWSIAPLASGSTFISERGTAKVKELTAGGELREVGVIPGVVPGGEAGLLGLAVLRDTWLYAYYTSESDNRIMRYLIHGEPGSYSIDTTPGQVILVGISKAPSHDGGRIKFGPDGMLYVTVGDARTTSSSQDPASLNGKILRMTELGKVPADNPFAGSYVYSMGHRNPQGITWDGDGQLWAAEFGQNTWDELNRIEAGANYGWPVVEGIGDNPDYVNPVAQWTTSEASPSGLVYTRGTFFMASLRGQRLWVMYPTTDGGVEAVAYFTGTYGRIRDVVAGPDGTLWFITNNTDGRGTPHSGDDQLWEVRLDVLAGG